MDQFIGPAFAKANDVEYQGIGQGSYGLARQLEGRLLQADVFVPITPGPIDILKKAGMIGSAVPVASTQMVIAYSPKSKFVPDFEATAQGKKIGMRCSRPPVCASAAPTQPPIRKGKTSFSRCCWRRTFTRSPGSPTGSSVAIKTRSRFSPSPRCCRV